MAFRLGTSLGNWLHFAANEQPGPGGATPTWPVELQARRRERIGSPSTGPDRILELRVPSLDSMRPIGSNSPHLIQRSKPSPLGESLRLEGWRLARPRPRSSLETHCLRDAAQDEDREHADMIRTSNSPDQVSSVLPPGGKKPRRPAAGRDGAPWRDGVRSIG